MQTYAGMVLLLGAATGRAISSVRDFEFWVVSAVGLTWLRRARRLAEGGVVFIASAGSSGSSCQVDVFILYLYYSAHAIGLDPVAVELVENFL